MPLHPSQHIIAIKNPRFWWTTAGIAYVLAIVLGLQKPSPHGALLSLEKQWKKTDLSVKQTLDNLSAQDFSAATAQRPDTTWASAPFSLWFYDATDSLTWWTGASSFLPPKQLTDSAAIEPGLPMAYLFPTPEGWYACWQKSFDSLGRVAVMAMVPALPKSWKLTLKPQPLSVTDHNGEVSFYVQPASFWRPWWHYWLLAFLLGCTALAGAIGANIRGNQLIDREKRLSAGLFVIAFFGIIYTAILLALKLAQIRQGYFFTPQSSLPVYAGNLFCWLLLSLLWLWLSTFVHRHLQFPWHSGKAAVFVLHAVSAVLLWANVAISGLLVKAFGSYFSADTVFEFSPPGFGVLAISLVFAIGTFLMVHRLQTFAVSVDGRLGYRLGVAALIAVLSGLFLPATFLHISWLQQSLGLILFFTGFDFFAEQETPSLTWVTVWILLIAAFCGGLNYNFVQNAPAGEAPLGDLSNRFNQVAVFSNPLTFFSIHFILLALLVGALLALNYYIHAAGSPFSNLRITLQSRLQRYLIAFTLGSFLIIGWFTGSHFQRSTNRLLSNHFEEKTHLAIEALRQYQGLPAKAERLQYIAQTAQIGLWLYSATGKLYTYADSRPTHAGHAGVLPPRVVPRPVVDELQTNQLAYYNHDKTDIYTVFRDSNGKATAYLGVAVADIPAASARLFPFLENLFNLYVFLLLATGAVAIALSGGITRPLAQIGEKLSGLQLGQNEPLQWSSRDEIGELVSKYNQMIEKLAESAERLKRSEREGAWREMAKQVAHEIKNPLTPMKLSVQHLQAAAKTRPEQAPQLLDRTTQTLIEQIDNLTHIANAFSNFAKMPTPENSVFALDNLVGSVYDLFVQANDRDIDFQLDQPKQALWVFADKNQLLRVVNNLIKNAIQAIPDERKGLIRIQLQNKEQHVLLSISDNGAGIPETIQQKVFYPNFTTKSSGMGLGLAICKNIIESAGGHIYFSTEEGKGTTFFIELPATEEGVPAENYLNSTSI